MAASFKYVEGIRMIAHHVPYEEGAGFISLIALDPGRPRAVLCEVATHLGGLQYGANAGETLEQLRHRIEQARLMAGRRFAGWDTEIQVWSPVVPIAVAARLINLETEYGASLSLVVNERYTQRIDKLKEAARGYAGQTDEPAFALLQLLARLR